MRLPLGRLLSPTNHQNRDRPRPQEDQCGRFGDDRCHPAAIARAAGRSRHTGSGCDSDETCQHGQNTPERRNGQKQDM